ncbi:prephenate dehydratase [Paenibacillus flagellatus]|uniref:Prephenate dehydratase n=1 Tax=Paenibacillus flagellatus TaxID=2211139 RepID=A0A2V5K3S9_9BACL|nr:prephenate dehydratase [Paenibacillus flagellatus]PYI53302.1 prephenate dehydratase [Paenibacillus flagellatus]
MKRIAFLGPEGTVSHEAARYFFAEGTHEFVPYSLMSDVFAATADGTAHFGVVPIENTIEGSVKHHIDLLVEETGLPIQAEWVYPSVQNLIGRASAEGEPYASVRKVVSKDVAIAQCHDFLRSRLPHVEFEYVNSTAEGVRLVKDSDDPSVAAIGTRTSAELYGLDLLAENITDHDNNYTRFIVVGKTKPDMETAGQDKTTILVTLPEDYPGALHQVLSAFAWRRINLSKIESRPTKKKLGNYYFYMDIEMSLDTVLLPAALQEIEAIGCQVRILGSYPSYGYRKSIQGGEA